MRLSTLFGRTLREAPADAESIAHRLVLRAGLARAMHAGSFALLPLGMRAMRRIEAIIHEEMERLGAQELRTPVVQAAAPWEQSGRYASYGPQMLRLTDRAGRALIVAPTHEEAIAGLAAGEIASYRQLPALVYQVHTKYRDELRPRGGLMRLREFTMLDAYSLDGDSAGLDEAYARVGTAFERIFTRCGVRSVAVEASGGEMGGREAREYMAISQAGEDTLAICDACGYAANLEVACAATANQAAGAVPAEEPDHPEEVATPGCATIADLARFFGVPQMATAKAVFFDTPERGLVFAVIRGDRDVNEHKLRAVAGVSTTVPATAEQIVAAGVVPGYASPVGLRLYDSGGVYVVADPSVTTGMPLIAGANRAGYHLRNVVYGRDWQATVVADIGLAQPGEPCARCCAPLRHAAGIEIGHIFKLGTRYAEAIGATYLDQSGSMRPIVMGSYGIGIERLLQVIVEQHCDAAGIVWPAAVAPLQVYLVRLGKQDATRIAADALYEELRAAGISVLYDDRDETAGVKFNDADLIGLPLRLVIGDRLLAEGMVELKSRASAAAVKVRREEIITTVYAGAVTGAVPPSA